MVTYMFSYAKYVSSTNDVVLRFATGTAFDVYDRWPEAYDYLVITAIGDDGRVRYSHAHDKLGNELRVAGVNETQAVILLATVLGMKEAAA